MTIVTDATVFLADVTLNIPIDEKDVVIRPAVDPVFRRRLAWVIVWANGGPHSCGRIRKFVAGSEPIDVTAISADGSGEGIDYRTAGVFCSNRVRPSAGLAFYGYSVPWRIIGADASGVRVTATLPRCATMSEVSQDGPIGAPNGALVADVVMGRAPCVGAEATDTETLDGVHDPSRLVHAPTGLTGTRSSGNGFLEYFDGAREVIRSS